jgi:hypothetical protein
MTDQNPVAPKRKPAPIIIDRQMPHRLILALDTYDITPRAYEDAVRGWLETTTNGSPAFIAARAILAAIEAAK